MLKESLNNLSKDLLDRGKEVAKLQKNKQYSEEEVLNITRQLRIKLKSGVLKWQDDFEFNLEEWFKQFKKK